MEQEVNESYVKRYAKLFANNLETNRKKYTNYFGTLSLFLLLGYGGYRYYRRFYK